MAKTITCEHCGQNPVSHRAVRLEIFTDWLFAPLFKPTDAIWQWIRPHLFKLPLERMAYLLMRSMVMLHLGKIIRTTDEHDSWRTRALWESAEKRGIRMERFQIFRFKDFRTLLIAHYQGEVRVFDGLPRPKGPPSHSIDWMDDKGTMREHFQIHSIPVAKGGKCTKLEEALAIFKQVGPPVIIKPRTGSRSRHTTVHITDEKELTRAFYIAKELSPWVVVEEELRGFVFRATIIGGKLIGVIRREPPHVVGNGKSTIDELIQGENTNPDRQGPIFHRIVKNEETDRELARQGLSFSSVPGTGEVVFLAQKVGRGSGGSTTELTPKTHSQNIELFEKVGDILKDPLVGIDFMIEDMERPWTEQHGSGVIECNSLPFIDLHHYPLFGEPIDVAGALWELVFPGSSIVSKT